MILSDTGLCIFNVSFTSRAYYGRCVCYTIVQGSAELLIGLDQVTRMR